MRCPQCKRALAFEAMGCACGWKLASRSSSPVARKPIERLKPMSAEHREELDRLLKGYRLKAQTQLERQPASAKKHMAEVTPGHGNTCTCESCWPYRIEPWKARALWARWQAEEDEPR